VFRKTKTQLQTIFSQESIYFASYHRTVWIKKKEVSNKKITMLYTGQLNEFIRLAEIDATNCDLLKEKITDGLCHLWTN
jgi:hypothetical protein